MTIMSLPLPLLLQPLKEEHAQMLRLVLGTLGLFTFVLAAVYISRVFLQWAAGKSVHPCPMKNHSHDKNLMLLWEGEERLWYIATL